MKTALLTVIVLLTLDTTWRIWKLRYPDDPKPVPEGEIEDAVIIYSWWEAFSMNAGRLRLVYALALAALLLAFV